jgi:hypothetical protein
MKVDLNFPQGSHEWKNKVYWKRVINTFYEIYNDHIIVDRIDSSLKPRNFDSRQDKTSMLILMCSM